MPQQVKRQNIEQFSSYDLFIALLSVLSIVNIGLYYLVADQAMRYVIGSIDILLSIFFFIEFLRYYIKSKSKLRYVLWEYGWADLLASLPFVQVKILRVFRLIGAYGIIDKIGPGRVTRGVLRNRASGALYLILFMIILLLEFASMAVLYAEKSSVHANITSASDAIWWVYSTITTVGYGDVYPVTNDGRLIGIVVMLTGVGLIGVLTGFLANKFVPGSQPRPSDELKLDNIQTDIAEIKALLATKNKQP